MVNILYNAFLEASSHRDSHLHRLLYPGPRQLVDSYILGSCPIDTARSAWTLECVLFEHGRKLLGFALCKSGRIAMHDGYELTILCVDGKVIKQHLHGQSLGMAVGPDDILYIAKFSGSSPIQQYDQSANRLQWPERGVFSNYYIDSTSIAVDTDGTIIVDVNYNHDHYGLVRHAADGRRIGPCGGIEANFHVDSLTFDRKAIAVNPMTRNIAASTLHTKIALNTSTGDPIREVSFDQQVHALAFDAAGTLVVGLETKVIIMEIESENARIYQTFGEGYFEGITDV